MGTFSLRQARTAGAALAVLLVSAITFSIVTSGRVEDTAVDIDAAIQQALVETAPESTLAADVYDAIAPSLVIIEARGASADTPGDGSFGFGTGVIVNADGSILTAHHVIAGAEAIMVTFGDGTKSAASVSAASPGNDTATLRPSRGPEVLVPAVIGSPRQLDIGDDAFVVGHPLGLAGSLSAGVISGFDRSIPITDDLVLTGLIQFDAAVNPGNSGGPLLNRSGQVVGIVTALANPADDDDFSGIGLAVPIGLALGGGGGGPGL